MRVVFMGTPEFAVPCLQTLHDQHQVVAVVTQPDRRSGRGQKIQYSPVKNQALAYNIPIYQPAKVSTNDFYQAMVDLQPDVIIVVAFGQKIPNRMLNLAKHGCINVHSSLLPKYRGAAPIHRAIINGDKLTGVTTMYLSEGWDEGDIILQAKTEITLEDTAGSLHDRLADLGSQLLLETLEQITNGSAPRIAQDHTLASFAPKLDKDDGEIDWQKSAEELGNFIRGMNPWPTAYTSYEDQTIKVWRASVIDNWDSTEVEIIPGKILAIDSDGILVGTGKGILRLEQLQRQGARAMDALDLANGLRLKVGKYFGF